MLRTELGNAPQRRMGSGVIANKVNNARGLDDEQNRVMIFATSLDGGIQISPMKSQMLDLKPKFFLRDSPQRPGRTLPGLQALSTNTNFIQYEYESPG